MVAPMQIANAEIQKEAEELKAEYKKAIDALNVQYMTNQDKLREKRSGFQDALLNAQSKINNIAANIAWTERQIEEERARKEREEREAKARQEAIDRELQAMIDNKVLTDKWDALTAGIPWREHALDHQITGAHFLTENRYVILGDPMGLGKTLTTIASQDMAFHATKDASEEFPWLGREAEVWKSARWINKETGEVLTGYIPYDKKMKIQEDPIWQYEDAHYATEIVDSVVRPVGRKILYICPAPLLRNVMAEYRNWAPHRNVTFIGNMPRDSRAYFLDNIMPTLAEVVVIVNYEAWRRDMVMLDKLVEFKFDTIIMDEAHAVKNVKTNAYRGVEKLVLGDHRPEYVIPMTGTPILNRPQELFPLLHIVNPDEFYDESAYLRNYCEQYEDSSGQWRWKFRAGGLDLLSKKIGKNFLRRTREQAGIKLPPKTVIYHDLELDEEKYADQARARKQMREWATIVVNKEKGQALSATRKIAVITRLRQIETWPAGIVQYVTAQDENGKSYIVRDPITKEKQILLQLDIEESQKVDYCISYDEETGYWDGLIPEFIEEERGVVFSQFKAPLQELANRINASGKKAVVFPGTSDTKLSDEIRKDFDLRYTPVGSEHKWDVVLCGFKSGGVGLNFTGATQLINLDDEWNPGKRDQAWDRIHRIGQERPVTIHVIRDKKTIDDWMGALMEDKESVVDGFTDKMASISANDILQALENGDI